MTKLSEELRDAIDGGDECRGRDSQLTEWTKRAEILEATIVTQAALLSDIRPYIERSRDRRLRKADKAKGQPPTDFHMGAVKEYEGLLKRIDAAMNRCGSQASVTDSIDSPQPQLD